MKKYLSVLCFCALICACKQEPEPQLPPQDALALIGGEAITQTDFENATRDLDEDFKKFIKNDFGKENFLKYLINERLIIKAAKDRGLEKSPQYIARITEIEQRQKKALAEAKDYTLNQLLMQQLEQDGTLQVSEQEIQAYYKKYPYQIYLLEILLDDPKEAADVTRSIRNAKTAGTFQDAVRRFSKDPVSKKKNGQLPPFIPGEYLPQIEVAAANTPNYQVQGFIKTARGFHIIMKTGEERLAYNQATKDRIKQILEKQKLDAYLSSLKDKYGVEVIDNAIK